MVGHEQQAGDGDDQKGQTRGDRQFEIPIESPNLTA